MLRVTLPLAALLFAAVALLAWTSFADAPWEDTKTETAGGGVPAAVATDQIRCEAALSFRESVIESGATSLGFSNYERELSTANREISAYC